MEFPEYPGFPEFPGFPGYPDYPEKNKNNGKPKAFGFSIICLVRRGTAAAEVTRHAEVCLYCYFFRMLMRNAVTDMSTLRLENHTVISEWSDALRIFASFWRT